MGKKRQKLPIGKVIPSAKSDNIYQVIGKIGKKLFGRKKGWGEYGGIDTGSRTKRNK
jgi:hypothetical protein